MNSQRIKKTIVIFFIFISFSSVVNAWPKVMFPPQAEAKINLADEMFVNGVPMQISMFKTRLSVEQVLQFYRNRWASDFSESVYEPWRQISHYKNKYFITIQLRSADVISNGFETLGRVNVSYFDEKAQKVTKAFPMLSDSKIINDIETLDNDKKGRTLILLNRQSLDSNVRYYREHFTKNNWTQVTEQQVGEAGHISIFKKSEDEVTINVRSVDGGSSVLVNEVLKKTWFN